MAAATANEAKISLKIMVHKEENRVIFAEADCNFVDTLFSIMTLPMGAIVRLLGKRPDEKFEAIGSLSNLCQSLMDLPANLFSTEEGKFMLLNPRSSSYDHCRKLKLNVDDTELTKYFICENWDCTRYLPCAIFSTCNIARCSKCGKLMNREIVFKDSVDSTGDDRIGGGVFVSDITTFIVTDDLCVMPNTSGCTIKLLIDLGITDTSHLEERTIDIGRDEMLDLLKWALLFNSPLTYLVLPSAQPMRDLVYPGQCNFDQCFIREETSTSSKRISLNIFLQKSTKQLLFAEAEDDFVDFVFGFLSIPLGTVIGMLNGTSSLVCMDNIYKSFSSMGVGRYIKSQDFKNILIQPQFGQQYLSENQIFPVKEATFSQVYWTGFNFYGNECLDTGFNCYGNKCLDTGFLTCFSATEDSFGTALKLKDPRIGGVLLKQSGMFMVTDDLVITPSSSISTINVLNKLKVPLNDVEKHEVSIGLEEGLRILKASLRTSSTLTNGLKLQLKKLNQEVGCVVLIEKLPMFSLLNVMAQRKGS